MKINTFKYFAVDACKSLKRNKTLSIASIATVAATLFILGIFMLVIVNVNKGIDEIGSRLEVKVFLKDDITMSEKADLERAIKNTEGFEKAVFETKAQALEKVKKQLGPENQELLEGFEGDNPFPNSYIVTVKKPEYVANVVKNVKDLPGVEKVKDARDIVDKIISFTKTIKWFGFSIFGVLLFVSLFLIGNTIKLTVYSRKKEIGIMKYVGATDWFIRWPFIIEGVIMGIVGSFIASITLYYLYRVVYLRSVQATLMVGLVPPSYIINSIMSEFVLGGIIIGAFGSTVSIRKFLKV
ncbi:cell division protein FtsX [Clostridium tepidiprofundi DSM 19306]|uniref:Cell division protein FtsX n=1 Tax=Clostridium tepidiprofundi DSM 19306 TaxID=1121338 RepID=A0A151B683_9CLOT|nr:permease-like cell division protein FtsX [Clostridium tepidiprofundi]KYH35416.1 cell division protein FtsX [Clostridium tepidiprofundi DSM 19306]